MCSLLSRRCTPAIAALLICSEPAAPTSSAPAARRVRSRETIRSSCRTSPAILVTTRRKRTAEATISTRTSGLPTDWAKRIEGAIRHAAPSSASRIEVRRARESVAGSSSTRIDGWSAAAPQRM